METIIEYGTELAIEGGSAGQTPTRSLSFAGVVAIMGCEEHYRACHSQPKTLST